MPISDSIWQADDLPSEPIDLPLWGGPFRVRTMTVGQRIQFEDQVAPDHLNGANRGWEIIKRLTVQCLADERGQRVFCDDDLPKLEGKNPDYLIRIGKAALRINKLEEDSVEQAAKN